MTDKQPTLDLGDLAEQTLGEFKLLRRLGRGGMAEVYLAEQTSLSRFVAVKILLPEMLKDADGVPLKRFEQEARTAGSINHANIVQVYTIGEQNGLHYIVQEFVEGMNLSEFVKRNGPPDAETGLRIMEHVATALKVAGQAGIVHRDIKPENIMLTQDDSNDTSVVTAKVADFGLAQLAQSSEALNLTQRGTTMGTPLYMSPEQINGQKLDERSDLYSFGVTCYHMFAGRAPFRGETAMAVAAQHLQDQAEPLAERRPDLPKAVCGLIGRMMNKEPADRFADANALLEAVLKAKSATADGQTDMSLSALGIPSIPSKAAARRSGRNQLLAFVLTCLSVGGVAALIGYVTRPTDPFSVKPAASSSSTEKTVEDVMSFALVNPESRAAWRAVIEHPSDAPLEGGWARIHLGRLYLETERYDRARELFSQVKSTNQESFLKQQGQIGLAAIAFKQGKKEQARAMVEDMSRDELANTAMYDEYIAIRQWDQERQRQARRDANAEETSGGEDGPPRREDPPPNDN
jgi:serine/threonine-protein kinase